MVGVHQIEVDYSNVVHEVTIRKLKNGRYEVCELTPLPDGQAEGSGGGCDTRERALGVVTDLVK